MARFDKLFHYFSTLSNCRNVLINKILLVNQQQVATLKSSIKDKLKSLKIPEPPKRPASPYLKYAAVNRIKVKEQHPEWSWAEITKQCSIDWKTFDSVQKQKLDEQYQKEWDAFTAQNAAYRESLTAEQALALNDLQLAQRSQKQHRKVKKQLQQANRPKRPIVGYLYFLMEKKTLSANKDKRLADVIKIYKDEWNTMSIENKQPYLKLAETDKVRYLHEIEMWEKRMISDGHSDLIRKSSKVIPTKLAATLKQSKDND